MLAIPVAERAKSMNDKTDFSYSFQVTQPTVGQETSDLIAFDTCKAYELPGKKLLIRNLRNGKSAVVTTEVFSALSLCESFRTADEHATRLLKNTSALPSQIEDVKRVLRSTLNDGLMVSASEICRLMTSSASVENASGKDDADKSVVVIITWERPAALQRLLNSILNKADPGNISVLYVVDDSRKTENIHQNQQIVSDFKTKTTIQATYFGQKQQQHLLSEIVRNVPQHEHAVRFLADQSRWTDYWSSGLARNYVLLLSVGRRVVVFDDDTIGEVYEPLERKKGISFSSEPREARFYQHHERWSDFQPRHDLDPIGGHLECLGLSFSNALQILGIQRLDPSSLANATIKDIHRWHGASLVMVTQCGTLGHSGTVNNRWVAQLQGASCQRMLESNEQVESAIRQDNLWLGYSRAHFSSVANMSQITGLDNRNQLPPYFPILRGEDRLFGVMLNYLFPDAVVMDYPWAAPHLPLLERSKSVEETEFGLDANFPQFFYEWVGLQKDRCLAVDIESRLAHLAQVFIDLGSSSHQQLAELYRDERAQTGCSTLLNLNEALARTQNAPENWREFLQKGFHKLNADLAASIGDLSIAGTPASLSDEELAALWCRFWRGYGVALKAWPEIRRAAQEVVEGRDERTFLEITSA